ncbi:MAG TPA: ArsC/Spx/MgsR family protein [Aridibacter sp.]|nr:ArsC/Spx/MgsR family protein [Aridibacter sp.]
MADAFRENGIEFERVNYFTDPLTRDRLSKLLKKAGIEPFEVLRKRERVFKELGLSPDTPDDQILDAIIEHPSLLERPIVEVGNKAVVARPIEKGIEIIKAQG